MHNTLSHSVSEQLWYEPAIIMVSILQKMK